jgi:hypothetical protein
VLCSRRVRVGVHRLRRRRRQRGDFHGGGGGRTREPEGNAEPGRNRVPPWAVLFDVSRLERCIRIVRKHVPTAR